MHLCVNGRDVEAQAGSVAELLALWGLMSAPVAVALNGTIIPRGAWRTTRLRAGDVVELLTATAGG